MAVSDVRVFLDNSPDNDPPAYVWIDRGDGSTIAVNLQNEHVTPGIDSAVLEIGFPDVLELH